jgi:hypothetical protein
MTYGFNLGLFAGSGPTIDREHGRTPSSSRAFRVWRSLDEDRRLNLVEEALAATANDDHADGYPVAL